MRFPITESNMRASDVLERINGTTDVNDNLAELRRHVIGQISQIKMHLR
jgi:hypothetical protein